MNVKFKTTIKLCYKVNTKITGRGWFWEAETENSGVAGIRFLVIQGDGKYPTRKRAKKAWLKHANRNGIKNYYYSDTGYGPGRGK